MKHHETENGGHYAVSLEARGLGVLVQIMEDGSYSHAEQARELLTTEEAIHLSQLLFDAASQHNRSKSQP
jgi:hypothetical protein